MRAALLLLFVLLLAGCSLLERREALPVCVGLDVATTVLGVKAGLIQEANPLWAGSVNAGHFLPFVLASVALYWIVDRYASAPVRATVAGVECGLGLRNLYLMR